MTLVAFFSLVAVTLAVQGYLSEPAAAGTNPSATEIRTLLHDAGVLHGIPPKILYAIAYQESAWRQFNANGDPLIGFDGKGIGIMQVTTAPTGTDVTRLRNDIAYNIDVGANILVEKWGYASTVIPVIGDGSTACYENWFYAVWAYNGWTAYNEYPYLIWGHVAAGPNGWWTGVPVTPVPKESRVDGFGQTIATPLPAHYWSATPRPKPALSAPKAPLKVTAGVRFTVSGTLSPRHPALAHSVEIRCYRYNGSTWVLRRTVPATNADSAGGTRYAARIRLMKAGRWRLRAYAPADAEHAAVSSALRYVRVR